MTIQIYDSMARKVVPLEAREPGRIGMYVCGPTVYHHIHIGNARTSVWFDLIRRYLTYRGYAVTYVVNYTDVDDKIIERSQIEGVPAEGIAEKYAKAFEEEMFALGVRPPDVLVRATDHVSDMVKAVQGLIDKGLAYEADGDVFFSVEKFPGYGKLSGRSLDEMRAGERVEPHAAKRHPLDFALWKAAKQGEPSWPSPWGPGRPGWHIECSVMSTKYLGMGFDIHGGGRDLIFPHHENEIAQAEGVSESEPFVRHWMHSGMVQMESEKMSKSLGNVVLAKELRERYPGEVVRYWALMSSYRAQAVCSEEVLEDAAHSYQRWSNFLEAAGHALRGEMPRRPPEPRRLPEAGMPEEPGGGFLRGFVEAMDDDFNSAQAFAVVHDLVRTGNKRLEGTQRGDAGERGALVSLAAAFLEITSVLGFYFPRDEVGSELVGSLVQYLLELREEARRDREFDRADRIRARLGELGVAVEDTPSGPRWRLEARR